MSENRLANWMAYHEPNVRKLLHGAFSYRVSQEKKKLSDAQETIKSLLRELTSEYINMYETATRLSQCTEESNIGYELKMISEVPEILDFDSEDTEGSILLYFYTKPILVIDPRTSLTHVLGQYKIMFRMFKDFTSNFGFYNMTWTVKGAHSTYCNHPHVWSDGSQCLGNVAGDFSNLVRNGDLLGFVVLSVEFLKAVNVIDTAGQLVSNWPTLYSLDGKDILQLNKSLMGTPKFPISNPDIDEKYLRLGMSKEDWDTLLSTGRLQLQRKLGE